MSLGGTAVLVSLDSSTSRADVAVRGEVWLSLGQRPRFWRVCAYIVQECDVCQSNSCASAALGGEEHWSRSSY